MESSLIPAEEYTAQEQVDYGLRCLFNLFSLLQSFSVPNPEGLQRANTCKHKHNGKSIFQFAPTQVPWLQLDPLGCPSRAYQPLPSPTRPVLMSLRDLRESPFILSDLSRWPSFFYGQMYHSARALVAYLHLFQRYLSQEENPKNEACLSLSLSTYFFLTIIIFTLTDSKYHPFQ